MITCTFEDGGTGKLRHVTVGVVLVNKEHSHVLLVRRSGKFSEPHKLAVPGGFVGRDETIEDAAVRETLEETGYNVENLRLLRINDSPNRPKEDRQNVDFVFIGEVSNKIGEHDSEIDNIKWFDLDKLPSRDEFAFDHFDNVLLYRKYLKTPFRLPVIGEIK